jgi:hypothetical protein
MAPPVQPVEGVEVVKTVLLLELLVVLTRIREVGLVRLEVELDLLEAELDLLEVELDLLELGVALMEVELVCCLKVLEDDFPESSTAELSDVTVIILLNSTGQFATLVTGELAVMLPPN